MNMPHVWTKVGVDFHLEVVYCVAVGVLGYVQEDEEVLSEVVSHSQQPGETVVREAEVHHLSGRRSRWLDELTRKHLVKAFIESAPWLPQ